MASTRVTLPGSTIHWPGYCACCLLALDTSAKLGKDGLAVPWCDDCQRHASMHKVERFALRGRWVSFGLFVLLLGLGLSQVLQGMPKFFTIGAAGTFLFFGIGLLAIRRLKLEDRKESCASSAFPVRLVAKDAAGVELECDNADFAVLLVEANSGATMSAPRTAEAAAAKVARP